MSRSSGQEYSDFMRANVFVPLGLTHTSVGIAPGLEPFIAQRYDLKQRLIPSSHLTSSSANGAGTIRTWDRTMPLTVNIHPDGDVHVHVEGQMEALLNDTKWEGNELTGRFAGTVPTSDADRWHHEILFSLRLRNGALTGMAAAETTTGPVYFALTSHASLTKKVAAK